MRYLKYLVLVGILAFPAAAFGAHLSIGVVVGPRYVYPPPPPVCPYGYYGPEFFVGGAFIGAGPWYRSYYRPRGFFAYRGYYGRGYYRRGYYGHGYYGHAYYAHPRYAYGRGAFYGHFRGGREEHSFRGERGFRGGMRGGFRGRGRR